MDFLEGLEHNGLSLEYFSRGKLSKSQIEYLSELKVPLEEWNSMNKSEQHVVLEQISERMFEMKVPESVELSKFVGEIFGKHILESYLQLEAPQDHIQIEQISDTISDIKELNYYTWKELEIDDKINVLNELDTKIAEIEHRPPCPIHCDYYKGPIQIEDGKVYGNLGGYSPITKDITLNSELLTTNNPIVFRELVDTVIHEGRHAYQDYNINVCEVHPRHSEVKSWADTMGNGKWEYWGDCSTVLGQRLYEQQSIEIDARNFAADVIENVEPNLLSQ